MSTHESDGTLVVYSDYVCPFCYLGKEALERYLAAAEEPPSVEWHQFDLQRYKRGPEGEIREDVDDGKDETYFEQVRENVERLAERYDVDLLALEDLPDDLDSWNAQQVALHVQRTHDGETFTALNDALFEALWMDGRDLGDPDVLVDVAESVGIDGDTVREAIGDESLAGDLEERFDRARREGVTGIPTFAYGEFVARGAVPPEQLERLVGAE